MAVAVKRTGKRRRISPNDIESGSRIDAQINIGHQLKVLAPFARKQTDCIEMLGRGDQVRIGFCSTAAAQQLSC
ncbi:hypothetical protein ES703_47390 [subsurface metagenome]